MSVSISAKLTLFKKYPVEITPNPKVPTRIESASGFTLNKADMPTGKFPIPKEFKDAIPSEIDVSQIIIDTKTKEFQMAIDIQPSKAKDFFLTKFSSVLTIDKLHLFVSCKKDA